MRAAVTCASGIVLMTLALLVHAEWAVQPLDHANPAGGTFRQRFELNATGVATTAPVFVIVGGENELSEWQAILGGQVGELAAKFGAQVLSAEHRGFGASTLGPDLSVAHLSFLTPEQAALDLFSLQQLLVGTSRVSASAPWILFGCSYSGLVASISAGNISVTSIDGGLVTQASPFTGVVASSAPLAAHTAFEEYTTGLIGALGDVTAGGSSLCAAAAKSALLWGGQAVANGTSQSWATLASTWSLCDTPTTMQDAQWAWRYAVAYVMGFELVQESRGYAIPYACTTLLSADSPQVGIGAIIKQANQGACGDAESVSAFVKDLGNTTLDPSSWGRQYFWLKCTVMGWFHVCDDPTLCSVAGHPSQPLPLSVFQAICKGAFGLEPSRQAAAQARFNSMFGGRWPITARSGKVQYVLGGADPWKALGAETDNASFEPPVITIDGGWHCADMDPLSQYSPPAVVAARKSIQEQVAQWLGIT